MYIVSWRGFQGLEELSSARRLGWDLTGEPVPGEQMMASSPESRKKMTCISLKGGTEELGCTGG